MKKVDSLKQLLLASVPSLKANPERLALFVDKGAVRSLRGSLSFEVNYTLSVWIEGLAGDNDILFVPILAWIDQHQPELLDRAAHEPFTFESEILDADTCDMLIEIQLSERVKVERRPNGKLRTTHLDDAPIRDVFPGAEDAIFWSAVLDDHVDGETLIDQ